MCVVLFFQTCVGVDIVSVRAENGEQLQQELYEGDNFTVQFKEQQRWGNNYKAEFILTNTGDTVIKNWRLQFDSFDTYTQIWNAQIESNIDGTYIIKNMDYNSNINPGDSVSFGVIAQYEGIVISPDYFELLGSLNAVSNDKYVITPSIQNEWDTGCILELEIKNVSDSLIEEWQLDFNCLSEIESVWNAEIFEGTTNSYTVTSKSYNRNIKPDSSVTIGMKLKGDYTGVSYPSGFVLSDNSVDFDIFEKGELLNKLSQNGYYYYFEYNENGEMTKLSVNEQPIFEGKYKDNQLVEMRYSNGEIITYSYYDGEALSCEINGKKAYEWKYDGDGELSEIVDYLNDITYTYSEKELDDNIIETTSINDGFSLSISEEELGTKIIYEYGDEKKYSLDYIVDAENQAIKSLLDGTKIYQNISENQSEDTIKKGNEKISSRIVTYEDGIINKSIYHDGTELEYFYDDKGNIIQINKNGQIEVTYKYTENDQLLRENNTNAGKTWVYEYDKGNNISRILEYEYTIKEELENVAYIKDYKYEYTDEWKDLLTSYDGQSITYDQIGNPLEYRDSMKLEWFQGRKLKNISYNEKNILYSYNFDGNRISKIINGKEIKFYYQDNQLIYQDAEQEKIWFLYDSSDMLVGFILNGTSYYYQKNILNDIIGIIDENGKNIVKYSYDAWGNTISIEGDLTIGNINPFRYRSYYYDSETGFYYLLNRYYDSVTHRFLNADQYISISQPNVFSYVTNNPIKYADPSGNVVETIIDIANLGYSFIELVKKPSWLNLGFLIWDAASVMVPFAPGSYVVKGGKKLIKVASKVSDFKTAKYLTIGTYSKVKKLFKGAKGIEVHHIIEKRFLKTGKMKNGTKPLRQSKMMSVPLEKGLHREITNRWREEFPYGCKYKDITKEGMKKAIEKIYEDMPALKKYALKYLNEVWKE